MAEKIKRLAQKHGPPVVAHFREHFHWHALGVGVVIVTKEFAASVVVDYLRHF